ncbi:MULTISPECIES: glycosyltransferase family 4 protein [unclassified Thioalkalivibrio]|uniref:glycosyltransferase family 4 protein n=1 Tax=unclassified Thioalkalivibrio TaxID=2621013 RepID=UPI000371FB69|nr:MULTISPECIES: glycosyltransferase family 4 protein [unclassified Thioalkalivibrio]
MARLLFVLNEPNWFVSHRFAIGLAAQERGFDVHVAGPGTAPQEILDAGMTFHSVNFCRKGMNPLAEFGALGSLVRLFRTVRPDIAHLVTIKPYLYGGIAARLAGVPAVVSAVAGLGTVFIRHDAKARSLRALLYPMFRLAFGHGRQRVIFQNADDRSVLEQWGVMAAEKAVLIRGSGADLKQYRVQSEPPGAPIVAFAARLLRDKGVVEFVDAARILKARGVDARFWIIGDTDPGNRATVTEAELGAWQEEGIVELLGYRTDIPELFGRAHIVCLPSYREGLPKVLVEGAAAGRAVVTTDVPGCRDAIEPDRTGLLVPARNPERLADALHRLIENADERQAMGRAGRDLAEREFEIGKIVDAHLDIYDDLLRVKERRTAL